MGTIYEITVRDNLRKLYENLSENLEESLPALRKGDTFTFTAFGETCVIEPERITFSGEVVIEFPEVVTDGDFVNGAHHGLLLTTE